MNPADQRRPEPSEEMLDDSIRQALRTRVRQAEPPDDVWRRISSQVSAGPSPVRRRPATRRLSQLFAPMVQGVAAVAILLLLGFSLGPGLWVQSYQFGSRQDLLPVSDGTQVHEATLASVTEPQGLVLETTAEDLLSNGALRRLEADSLESAGPYFVQTSYPALDPVLAKHVDVAAPVDVADASPDEPVSRGWRRE